MFSPRAGPVFREDNHSEDPLDHHEQATQPAFAPHRRRHCTPQRVVRGRLSRERKH